MQPIVNRLKEQYGTQIAFLEMNAQDGAQGEAAFELINLPGHPAFIIVQPDGKELWRSVGEQPQSRLETGIEQVLKAS